MQFRSLQSRFSKAAKSVIGVITGLGLLATPVALLVPRPELKLIVLERHTDHTGGPQAAESLPSTVGDPKPTQTAPPSTADRRSISTFVFKLNSQPEDGDISTWGEDTGLKGVMFIFAIEDLGCARNKVAVDLDYSSGRIEEKSDENSLDRTAEFKVMLQDKAGWARLDILHDYPKAVVLKQSANADASGQRTGITYGPPSSLIDLHAFEVAGPPTKKDLWQVGTFYALPIFTVVGVFMFILAMCFAGPPDQGLAEVAGPPDQRPTESTSDRDDSTSRSPEGVAAVLDPTSETGAEETPKGDLGRATEEEHG